MTTKTRTKRVAAVQTPLSVISEIWLRGLELPKSPATVRAYREALKQFNAFLTDSGMPTDPTAITREHIGEFVKAVARRTSASTAAARYRALSVFFSWCVAEDEISENPMEKMHPPHVTDVPPDVLRDDELDDLLDACKGRGFMARRDLALVSLIYDSGLRRAEAANLKVTDLDRALPQVRVLGKGDRVRIAPFGVKTEKALRAYLRERARHSYADTEWLFLGHSGRLTASGIYLALVRRAEAAGVDDFHPHLLRHRFAHSLKEQGEGDELIMRLGGWRSQASMARYGRGAADERARNAYRNRHLSPLDRVAR